MAEVIVALDLPTAGEARALYNRLRNELGPAAPRWWKVGPDLLLTPGCIGLIDAITHQGSLMLDLKAWGTSDCVRRTVRNALYLGANLVTVKAEDAIVEAALEASAESAVTYPYRRILVVGNLTSVPEQANPVGCYLDRTGAVVPAIDLKFFRRYHPNAILVTPGVRLRGSRDDHSDLTVTTPAAAVRDGADYLVVGRPIYAADDPVAAYREFVTRSRS